MSKPYFMIYNGRKYDVRSEKRADAIRNALMEYKTPKAAMENAKLDKRGMFILYCMYLDKRFDELMEEH